MGERNKAIIFVSYSREDEGFVSQIVKLLRTAIAGIPSVKGNQWEFVFQDIDHLVPGDKWEENIDNAISRSERLFVFWCKHSASSNQVKREYKLGQSLNKVIIPVLLDNTSLPDELSKIHGVDIRELGVHEPAIVCREPSDAMIKIINSIKDKSPVIRKKKINLLDLLKGSENTKPIKGFEEIVVDSFSKVLGADPKIMLSNLSRQST